MKTTIITKDGKIYTENKTTKIVAIDGDIFLHYKETTYIRDISRKRRHRKDEIKKIEIEISDMDFCNINIEPKEEIK